MAGSYTKKEFGVGSEEQTLLKDSHGTRIVPAKGIQYFSSLFLFFSPPSTTLIVSAPLLHFKYRRLYPSRNCFCFFSFFIFHYKYLAKPVSR